MLLCMNMHVRRMLTLTLTILLQRLGALKDSSPLTVHGKAYPTTSVTGKAVTSDAGNHIVSSISRPADTTDKACLNADAAAATVSLYSAANVASRADYGGPSDSLVAAHSAAQPAADEVAASNQDRRFILVHTSTQDRLPEHRGPPFDRRSGVSGSSMSAHRFLNDSDLQTSEPMEEAEPWPSNRFELSEPASDALDSPESHQSCRQPPASVKSQLQMLSELKYPPVIHRPRPTQTIGAEESVSIRKRLNEGQQASMLKKQRLSQPGAQAALVRPVKVEPIEPATSMQSGLIVTYHGQRAEIESVLMAALPEHAPCQYNTLAFQAPAMLRKGGSFWLQAEQDDIISEPFALPMYGKVTQDMGESQQQGDWCRFMYTPDHERQLQ